jgi:NADH-quinone oxidoreductase subunit N
MSIGTLLALLQNNVKRILAYSSIAHTGYLLVAFEASSAMASKAVAFYLFLSFCKPLPSLVQREPSFRSRVSP